MKQIAIFGGTFDPVHNGHLKLAENTVRQFSPDELWFMPAPNPPHKSDHRITDYADRMNMVRLAIQPFPQFSCSDFEAGRSGKSYTSDTLSALSVLFPDVAFSFVLGADSFYEVESWHAPGTVLKLARLIVADRDYENHAGSLETQKRKLEETYGAKINFIRAPEVDISSERLREMLLKNRKGVEKFLPKQVLAYIESHRLYTEEKAR